MGKLKCTPGPCVARSGADTNHWWIVESTSKADDGFPIGELGSGDGGFAEGDAKIFAEAINAFHETGMTPRELAIGIEYLKEHISEMDDYIASLEQEIKNDVHDVK